MKTPKKLFIPAQLILAMVLNVSVALPNHLAQTLAT
jgi:hypothetical protein